MTGPALRLFTDGLDPDAMTGLLGGCNRVLYLAEGGLTVTAGGVTACLAPNSAWYGSTAETLRAGPKGALVLRFELATASASPAVGAGVTSHLTLTAPLALDPAAAYLLRCDRVDFPPGGVAYTHMHQGPGIRCLESGRIRIETRGMAHEYGPGEAWFESGPEPVFAAASPIEATHFIRCMVLPRGLLGRSSIRYLRPEDQDKPKLQAYQIFIDVPIDLRWSAE